jgi:hypothetical protein
MKESFIFKVNAGGKDMASARLIFSPGNNSLKIAAECNHVHFYALADSLAVYQCVLSPQDCPRYVNIYKTVNMSV